MCDVSASFEFITTTLRVTSDPNTERNNDFIFIAIEENTKRKKSPNRFSCDAPNKSDEIFFWAEIEVKNTSYEVAKCIYGDAAFEFLRLTIS